MLLAASKLVSFLEVESLVAFVPFTTVDTLSPEHPSIRRSFFHLRQESARIEATDDMICLSGPKGVKYRPTGQAVDRFSRIKTI